MPFSPSIVDQRASIIGQTAAGLENNIGQAIAQFQADHRKDDAADGAFQAYVQTHGNDPSIGDTLAKWHGMSPDKKWSFIGQKVADDKAVAEQQQQADRSKLVAAQVANFMDEIHARNTPFTPRQVTVPPAAGAAADAPPVQMVSTSPNSFIPVRSGDKVANLTPEDKEAGRRIGYVALRQSDGTFKWVQDPKQSLKAADSFEKLNNDVLSASGVPLSSWQSNTQHDLGKHIGVEIPAIKDGAPVTDDAGNPVAPSIKLLDKPTYQKFVDRYNALSSAAPDPAAASATEPPLPGVDPGAPAGAAAPAAASAPVITSQQGYDSLPSGSLYTDSRTGAIKRKK